MLKRLVFILGFILLLNTAADSVHADTDNRDLKVMTRNMDAGTDLKWFFVPGIDPVTAASLTFAQVVLSDIPGRAALLANEIGAENPDLIGLQEVTLWQAGPPGGPPTIILDQLQSLLDALAARNLHYAPAAVNMLTSIAA